MRQLLLGLSLACGLLTACGTLDAYKHHDPTLQLEKKQYEEKLTKAPAVALEATPKPLPVPANTIEVHSPSLLKVVSLSTTQELPLKDVFLSLARQADINIVLDPRIQGGITFHGKNRKFIDVVREICQMSGLRYKIVNDMVRIEPDIPYLKSYNIQYLAITRENQSRISIATDVFTAVDGRNNEMDNGSNNLLTGNSKNDFWSELEQNISTILLHSDTPNRTQEEPRYSLHRQAGVISVFATQLQHEQIQEYLRLLAQNVSSQVLIEAKIVEVNLKDEFKSGINWNSLKGDFVVQSPLGKIVTPGNFDPKLTPPRDVFTIGGHGHHLTGLLSLMQRFGTVRTLSSPRMTVMNNQSAVLKVATNQVFFRIDYDREFGYQNTREREHVSSEVQTVPIGLVMVVQPSINPENGNIIMTLRPTISRVVEEKEDPAVAIVSKQTQRSMIPQVQVREFDSVINMQSGEIVVLGGLMEERSDNEQSGLPGINDVSVLKDLFGSKSNDRMVTELVVFLRATIVDSSGQNVVPIQASSVQPADQQVYETFTRNPRPLVFSK
jgi:MSHA type pilus biogenesis protein MshL